MEVAYQWNIDAVAGELLDNLRYCLRCGLRVDGNPYQFRAGPGKFRDLFYRGGDIRRVCVGHGLHHDRGVTTNNDMADSDGRAVSRRGKMEVF